MGLHGLLSSSLNPLSSVIGSDRIKPWLSLIIPALFSLLRLISTTADALICLSASLSVSDFSLSLAHTERKRYAVHGWTDGQMVMVNGKTDYTKYGILVRMGIKLAYNINTLVPAIMSHFFKVLIWETFVTVNKSSLHPNIVLLFLFIYWLWPLQQFQTLPSPLPPAVVLRSSCCFPVTWSPPAYSTHPIPLISS